MPESENSHFLWEVKGAEGWGRVERGEQSSRRVLPVSVMQCLPPTQSLVAQVWAAPGSMGDFAVSLFQQVLLSTLPVSDGL